MRDLLKHLTAATVLLSTSKVAHYIVYAATVCEAVSVNPPAPPPRPLVLIWLTGRILLLDDSESLDATVTTVVYIFHASPSDHGSPMRAGGPLVSHMFEKYSVYMQGEKENFETHRPHWSEETLNKHKQLESCLFVVCLFSARRLCVCTHHI